MKIEDILAPIDFSPGSFLALDYAIAADLHFSLIVMGIRGRHQGRIEEVLFGSTAEKVLRAARIPVVCVPPQTGAETNEGMNQ